MKLEAVPPGMIDWAGLPSTVLAGATGTAVERVRQLDDIRLRVVEYRPGYLADHWCAKGHVLFVLSGGLVIEHQDGSRYELGAGTSWHVADQMFPPHRVLSERGARVFIVD